MSTASNEPNAEPGQEAIPTIILIHASTCGSAAPLVDALAAAAGDIPLQSVALTSPASAFHEELARTVAACGSDAWILAAEPSLAAHAERAAAAVNDSGSRNVQMLPAPSYDRPWAELLAGLLTAALARMKNTGLRPILRVEGHVENPAGYRFPDLLDLPDQVPDVGVHVPGREGRAVWVRELLNHAGLKADSRTVGFRSGEAFSADIDIAQALATGLLVYAREGNPLSISDGGPVRLFVPGTDDRCANVKAVDQIVVNP